MKSFLDVQEVVRAGRASAYFPIGLQLGADWNYTSRVLGCHWYRPRHTNRHRIHPQLDVAIQRYPQNRQNLRAGGDVQRCHRIASGTYIFTTNGAVHVHQYTGVPAWSHLYQDKGTNMHH